ncbi:hypothetical protein [Lutibacter flavus]|uniref:3-keto-disaccharide hydrolase domain-containing protein n=1 Tax=Lutibacter flavus TaxID=691689 RepID=A0A238YUS2_9FLAO|nr:hypothetical protein [Lutibacter flavus]SNR74887.1 hypothetical protein SAMN04488111_2842 [Lutibacter flavus]
MKNILIYKQINKISNLKNLIQFFGLTIFALTLFGCSSDNDEIQEPIEIPNYYNFWDFETLDGWVDGSQNMNGIINYNINDGVLNIFTRANTWDRPKVRTVDKIYKKGKYSWRVFVPEMGVGDMASIGAFLYFDETHELDFEIGYGTTAVRQSLDATDDDLIVYMTSQDNPFQSIPHKIKRNQWYTLQIELLIVNGKYQAVWYINNNELVRLDLEYDGSIPFYIFCSVENLTFLGDHNPNQDNYALFDYVEIAE